MAKAFQSDAFQNDAFQTADESVPVPVHYFGINPRRRKQATRKGPPRPRGKH